MKTFDVEVPIYLRVRVEAPDEGIARTAASNIVDDYTRSPASNVGMLMDDLNATVNEIELVKLSPGEDDLPDVYLV